MTNTFNDFLKTKQILLDIVASASGWDQHILDIEIASGPLVFLYAYDLPTQWIWQCAVSREMFAKLIAQARTAGEVEVIRSGLAQTISKVAAGDLPDDENGLDWQHQLGALITGYAASTQTLQLADDLVAGGHFVVLHYRQAGQANGLLRPIAMGDTGNTMLPVERLRATIERVIELDRQNHPEWIQ